MFKKFMRSQWRAFKQGVRRDVRRNMNKKPTIVTWIVVLFILAYLYS